MRKVVAVVALVSSSIACGGFLGFGDDDDPPAPPPPPSDGGPGDSNVDAADGGSPSEPLPPGCTRHAFTVKGATDVDAALASAGWKSGQIGNATIEIENGELVLRTPGAPAPVDEANVSFRRDGVITRVTCTTTIEVSSFSAQSRFVQMRLVGSEWGADNYYVWSEWRPEGLISGVQGNPVIDSGKVEAYSPLQPSPAANQKLSLSFELTAEPPKFVANIGGKEMVVTPQRPPGAVDYARVILGLDTNAPSGAGFSTRLGDIECVTCVAQ